MSDIFHFCQDEKFINSAYSQFETLYPNRNKFLVYDADPNHIKHLKVNAAFRFVSDLEKEMEQIPPYAIVVFHSLPNHILKHIFLLNDSVQTIWLFFGYEVYNDTSLYSENRLLDTITKKLFGSVQSTFKERLYAKALPVLRLLKPSLGYSIREKKIKELKRINYLGCPFEEEYRQIKKITKIKAPIFNFWYYPLEKILDVNKPIHAEKNNILIGNSGTASNNHLDVLEKLKKLKVKNERIILPVSYGDKTYIQQLKNTFHLPDNKVVFLDRFLFLDEYNALLADAKIAIFNTGRQQAIGNIISLIYQGTKVFISEKNTVYHFLKRNKVLIYSYENELVSKHFNTALEPSEIESNRKILFDILNSEKLLHELDHSLKKILK